MVALPASPGSAVRYSPGVVLFTFRDPAITESSGVSASSRSDDVFFTHNDSGDVPRFFAVDRTGATLATFTVVGAEALDWEDMARGRGGDGGPALFFADIGDNRARRDEVTVYEVAEPAVDVAALGVAGTVRAARHRLRYEDGPHDAESLLVHPASGHLAVVTKEAGGVSGVYAAPPPLGATAVSTLHKVADISFPALTQSPGGLSGRRLLATGSAVAPDGRRLAVRTYDEAFEWSLDGDLEQAMAAAPQRVALPFTVQGEGIAYTRDGRSMLTTTEGANAPAHLLAGDGAATPTSAPRGTAGGRGGRTTGDRRSGWAGAIAAVAVLLVGASGAALRRRRREPRGPAEERYFCSGVAS